MKDETKITRQSFLGLSSVGFLSVVGWLTGCRKRDPESKPPLDSRFTYDVSRFEHTDPALMLYHETTAIPTGLDDPKCIAAGQEGTIYVGGDKVVKHLDGAGHVLATVALTARPLALTATKARLCIAFKDHLEIRDFQGKLLSQGETLGGKTYLTGVADGGDSIYLADAGNRQVIRCDTDGKVVSRFGNKDDVNPGFVIPSTYFHIMLGPDGLLWVNNTGHHQIEAYTTDGKFELGWGAPSMGIEGFCGCCNPVYFTRRADGKFVTSEKGLNRIKIYDVKGNFEGVVAGTEQLVKDLDLAKKACADCQIGFGFDVACDSADRVLALDPATKTIRVFTPKIA